MESMGLKGNDEFPLEFPLEKLFQICPGNIFYATLLIHLGIPNHEFVFARLDKS
jgi:hypothetical protein